MPTAKSLQEIALLPRTSPDWIIQNFLKRHNTMLIQGQPKKACKSWLILNLCWDLSEGRPVWGLEELEPPRPICCVYFTQEDTEDDIQDRIIPNIANGRKANGNVWIIPKNLEIIIASPNEAHTKGRKIVQQELDDIAEKVGRIDLVAFDPMRRIHAGDENDSVTITQIWAALDRIHRRYGCATLMAHHLRKPSGDPRIQYDPTDPNTGRGSGDIYGGGDAFINVVPGKGTKEMRRVGLFFESKRGRPIEPVSLKVSFSTGRIY